jgi:hypothetical protein
MFVRLTYGNKKKLFEISEHTTFNDLRDRAVKASGKVAGVLELYYLDGDGMQISVDGQADWNPCLNEAKTRLEDSRLKKIDVELVWRQGVRKSSPKPVPINVPQSETFKIGSELLRLTNDQRTKISEAQEELPSRIEMQDEFEGELKETIKSDSFQSFIDSTEQAKENKEIPQIDCKNHFDTDPSKLVVFHPEQLPRSIFDEESMTSSRRNVIHTQMDTRSMCEDDPFKHSSESKRLPHPNLDMMLKLFPHVDHHWLNDYLHLTSLEGMSFDDATLRYIELMREINF